MSTSHPEATSRSIASADLLQSPEDAKRPDEMDWEAYAEHYDEMCALNPAYQDNIETLLKRIADWDLPTDSSICDLGAGTGNYILRMNDVLPNARYWHVDLDYRMIEMAREKYQAANIRNVHFIHSNINDVDFPAESFDIIVCINALYAFGSQSEILRKMHAWLKASGRLFLIDFGRPQRTLDWTFYMFCEAVKNKTVGRYAKALVEARELLKQNRKTTKGQASGRYWLHSTEDFGKALQSAGFGVDELTACYRNYADLAVCRK